MLVSDEARQRCKPTWVAGCPAFRRDVRCVVAGALAKASAAILLLHKYPRSSVEELRGPLALSHSGCVRLVDRLEGQGNVERRVGTDARAVAISLTRKGRDAAAVARDRREQVLLAAVQTLTADEQGVLGKLVTKLLDSNVAVARTAMRTCRLCDYDACAKCPMHKFASEEPADS